MRILYITHTDSLGGANQALFQLICSIKDQHDGFDITVIMPYGGDEFARKLIGVNCRFLRFHFAPCVTVSNSKTFVMNYLMGRINYRRIFKRVKKLDFDLIHTNSSVCDLGIYLAKRLKVPHIWHVREVLEYYDMRLIMPKNYRKSIESGINHVICISNYIKDYIKSRYSNIDARVIYDGFPVFDNEVPKPKQNNNLIVAGMIYKNKGQLDAIKALSILINKHNRDDVKLYIVGTHASTREYESFLMDYVSEQGLEKNVLFIPYTDKLNEIREKCSIALQCSIMEGFGLITIESMLNHLLVIGARSGATCELIEDGVNGWLYEPNNVEDLAERINYVLDYEGRNKVRDDAYNWAKKNFDIRVAAREFMKLYEEVLSVADE